jgi:hypothetical protein
MNDEYRTLLLDAYKANCLGRVLFGAFAARESGEHAEKLRVLQRIEGTTAEHLRPLLDAAESRSPPRTRQPRARRAPRWRSGIEWTRS